MGRLRMSALRVKLGYVVGLAVFVLASPTLGTLALGGGLAVAGESVRIWASGHIEKTRTLATGGPYAHTRNPLYLGSSLLALGVVASAASIWAALAVVAYVLAFYPAVMREEAAFLAARFPDVYPGWARAVPSFIPRLTPAGPAESRFRWARVSANREWRTCLAIPVLFGLLFVRGLWP